MPQDTTGPQVAEGEYGEVRIRSPKVMAGYFRDPEQTLTAVDSKGWLHFGDIGIFGPQGDLSIDGRSKDMVICAGFNVFSAEIEKVIAGLLDVAQCAVVGRVVAGYAEIVAYVESLQNRVIDVVRLHVFLLEAACPLQSSNWIRFMDRMILAPGFRIL